MKAIETYKTSDSELKSALQEYVGNKGSLDKNDKVFIEKTKKETPKTENTNEIVRDKVKAVIGDDPAAGGHGAALPAPYRRRSGRRRPQAVMWRGSASI